MSIVYSKTCVTCEWCIPRRVHFNGYRGPDCAHPKVIGHDIVYGRPVYEDCYVQRSKDSRSAPCGAAGDLWELRVVDPPPPPPPPTKWEKFVAWLKVDRRPPFYEELTK